MGSVGRNMRIPGGVSGIGCAGRGEGLSVMNLKFQHIALKSGRIGSGSARMRICMGQFAADVADMHEALSRCSVGDTASRTGGSYRRASAVERRPLGRGMIRTISIQDYRSFDPASSTTISFDATKRVAYFYGLNGAGKSAIGQVVHGCGTGQNPIPNCSLSIFPQDSKYEYLVYNDHFVETNFRNRSDVPGIFTIGDPESSALEAAEGLEQEIATWRGQHESLVEQEQLRQAEADNARESAIGGVWKSYTALKDGPFKPWLPYGNSKQRF